MSFQSISFKRLSTLALGAALSAFGCASADASDVPDRAAESDDPSLVQEVANGEEANLGQLEQALCAAGVVIGPLNHFAGTTGTDTITGTAQVDVLGGAGCSDVISAANGNDVVSGGGGDDDLNGGGGNDVLTGNSGNDTLDGSVGDDVIFGDEGADILDGGGNGDDTLVGGCDGEVDTLDGGPGQDVCVVESLDIAVNCEIIINCP